VNRLDHLMTIAAEECAEIAQRISKAQRFGLGEVQPDQGFDNAERIRSEFVDLYATLQMIEVEAGLVDAALIHAEPGEVSRKQGKIEEFLKLSAKMGMLD